MHADEINNIREGLLLGSAASQAAQLRRLGGQHRRLGAVLEGFEISRWGMLIGPPGFRISSEGHGRLEPLKPTDRYPVPVTDAFLEAFFVGIGRGWRRSRGLTKLTHLHLSGSSLTTLTALEDLDLTHLTISKAAGLVDLESLTRLRHLSELRLTHVPEVDLQLIADLGRLRSLLLVAPGRVDPSYLPDLTGLDVIHITDCANIDSIDPLLDLDLVGLNLSGCPLRDCLDIGELRDLERLDLGGCPVEDYEPLTEATSITHLTLGAAPSLRELPLLPGDSLREMTLTGMAGLRALPSLKRWTQLFTAKVIDCPRATGIGFLTDVRDMNRLVLSNVGFRAEDLPEGVARRVVWR